MFGRKHFADHTAPLMPQSQKNLVKQAFECGAVKILQDNVNSNYALKEIAVKQAVDKMINTYATSDVVAYRVVWEFANAIGWNITKPKLQVDKHISIAPQILINESNFEEQPAVGLKKYFSRLFTSNKKHMQVAGNGDDDEIGVASKVSKMLRFSGINWLVLDEKKGKALLISEKILEKRPYHMKTEAVTWENCTLRKYLNEEFYDRLGEVKIAIVKTRNKNPNNLWSGANGGKTTTDKVFLLSYDEMCLYFSTGGNATVLSDYKEGYDVSDENNIARISKDANGNMSGWHLRSPGLSNDQSASVHPNGTISKGGSRIGPGRRPITGSLDNLGGSNGVRPALWIDLKLYNRL